ncbi:MAG: T9SS type A sorting domain-containing protein [Saprospiraceae bacterium]|nr:T9SS type A sorting domain-containing protein [Saprospiraceae bacterium]
MITRLFFLFICAHLASVSLAQSYKPVLVPGREWTVGTSLAYEQCFQAGLPPWSDCTYRTLNFMSGDTLVAGTNYQKWMERSFSVSSSWQGPFTLSQPMLKALVREDTTQRHLYMWQPDMNQEVLLADFSLTTGQQATIWKPESQTFTTLQVDSTWLLPDGRRKWVFGQYFELVEGVVWGHGLSRTEICFEACTSLACVTQQDTAMFTSQNWPFTLFSNGPYCDYTTVATDVIHLTNIQVSPNPGNGIFHISGLPENAQGQVYDAQGKLLFDTRQVQQIDLSAFPPGIYGLRIFGPVSGFTRLVRE